MTRVYDNSHNTSIPYWIVCELIPFFLRQVLSYDGLHAPDSLAVTAAGIAVYVHYFYVSFLFLRVDVLVNLIMTCLMHFMLI